MGSHVILVQTKTFLKEYCKCGYFRWGKILRKCWQDISREGNFHETTPISFINAYGFYFRVGVIFAKKTKARKTRKLPSRKNFHVYITWKLNSPNLLCLMQQFMLLCVTITAGKSKSPLQGIPTLSGTAMMIFCHTVCREIYSYLIACLVTTEAILVLHSLFDYYWGMHFREATDTFGTIPGLPWDLDGQLKEPC